MSDSVSIVTIMLFRKMSFSIFYSWLIES